MDLGSQIILHQFPLSPPDLSMLQLDEIGKISKATKEEEEVSGCGDDQSEEEQAHDVGYCQRS